MKCPKCGSDHTLYVSNTSHGSFSLRNACCGSILLGPPGVLFGLCGMSGKIDDFWIHHDCGCKYFFELVQEEIGKIEEYEKNLQSMGGMPADEVRTGWENTHRLYELARNNYKEFLKSLKQHPNSEIRNSAYLILIEWTEYLAIITIVLAVMAIFSLDGVFCSLHCFRNLRIPKNHRLFQFG